MSLLTCGIDLGASFSYVAIAIHQHAQIIQNDMGKLENSSYVGFNNDRIVVGEEAKFYASSNIKNTVYDITRLIGRKYSDKEVQEDIKHWGFKVEEDETDGGCLIKVEYKGEEHKAKPQEILSHILNYLGELVRIRTGEGSKTIHAVITVHACFDNNQRKAIIEAAELAGLNVLQLINKPTAAGVLYMYKYAKKTTILVYDFGGGSFDASIIEVKKNEITVKASRGDDHLGGEDITSNLVNYYVDKLRNEAGVDIRQNSKQMWKLRKACEEAKIMLSEMNVVDIDYDLLDNYEIDTELIFPLFNRINDKIFKKTIDIVDNVLTDCGLCKNEIDDIILIGGSSQIPRVVELLSEIFAGKRLNLDINPYEVVAMGAAILSEDILIGVREEKDENGRIKLIDSTTNRILNSNDRFLSYIDISDLQKDGRKILIPDKSRGRKILMSKGMKGPIMDSSMRRITIIEILSNDIYLYYEGNLFFPFNLFGSRIPFTTTKDCFTNDNNQNVNIDLYEKINGNTDCYRCIYKHVFHVKPLPKGEVKCNIKMYVNRNGIVDFEIIPEKVSKHSVGEEVEALITIDGKEKWIKGRISGYDDKKDEFKIEISGIKPSNLRELKKEKRIVKHTVFYPTLSKFYVDNDLGIDEPCFVVSCDEYNDGKKEYTIKYNGITKTVDETKLEDCFAVQPC